MATGTRPSKAPRRTTRRAIYDAVWERPVSQVAAEHGVPPGTLFKICDRLEIPYPDREQRRQLKVGARLTPPPLPDLPDQSAETVDLDPQPAQSRRQRTRMQPEERRAQLLDVAASVVRSQGPHACTIKSVAREAGISEAQAFNLFPGKLDLLIELARRELSTVDKRRRAEVDRGTDRTARIVLSTVHYIRSAAEHGALIQALIGIPEVRKALKADDSMSSRKQQDALVETMVTRDGADPQVALGLMTIMNAMVIRAGRLVANGHTSMEVAERICVPMVVEGNRRILRPGASRSRY